MNTTKHSISIVSPVYKAEKIVDKLVKRITEEVSKLTDNYEIILVEDGSDDNSWNRIEENCLRDKNVKGIKLTRNFGQHFAITAGLKYSSGNWVVVMDCDLQDNPKYISEMIELAQEGYEIIFTRKIERKHSFFKNITASAFYFVLNYLTDNLRADKGIGCYSLLSRKVVDAFIDIKDYRRHYLMILRWLGFKYTYLEVKHENRFEGKSTYSWSKLIMHALDGITSQSDKLLRLSIAIGLMFFVVSLLISVYLVISFINHGALAGWTSLMIAVFVSTGFILIAVGILGIYIGKIFEQTKERPLYVVHKKLNF